MSEAGPRRFGISAVRRRRSPRLLTALLLLAAAATAAAVQEEPISQPPLPSDGITESSLPPSQPDPEQWAAFLGGRGLSGGWFGAREALEARGIEFDASLTFDWIGNLAGGFVEGSRTPYLVDLQLSLDLGPLIGWKGGEVFALGQIQRGSNASASLVGDLQGFDNIETPSGISQLSQLWFRQTLLEERLAFKVGKLDFLSDFASPPASQGFINSGMNSPITINPMAAPTYPNQAFGVVLQGRPLDWLGLGAGIYDGSNPPALGALPSGTGPSGPGTFFDNEAGYFVIGELDLNWSLEGLPGVLGLGGWGHTGSFERFDGRDRRGAQGAYASLQQTLWLADRSDLEAPSLSLWLTGSIAPESLDPVAWSVAGGILWNGPIPGRPEDALGVGVAYAAASTAAGSPFTGRGELAVEAYYRIAVTPWLSVQPDLQVIATPGAGASGDLGTAVVGILRVIVDF